MTWDTARSILEVVWFLLLVFAGIAVVGCVFGTAAKVDGIANDLDRIKRMLHARENEPATGRIIDVNTKGMDDA
jgi:hypothetical protein